MFQPLPVDDQNRSGNKGLIDRRFSAHRAATSERRPERGARPQPEAAPDLQSRESRLTPDGALPQRVKLETFQYFTSHGRESRDTRVETDGPIRTVHATLTRRAEALDATPTTAKSETKTRRGPARRPPARGATLLGGDESTLSLTYPSRQMFRPETYVIPPKPRQSLSSYPPPRASSASRPAARCY